MDIMFSDTVITHHTTPLWSAEDYRTELLTLFRAAAQRAQQHQRQILVSITFPVTQNDALHVFAAFQQLAPNDRFYWERSTDKRALVGIGQAAVIETTGTHRVADAATAWREIRQQAMIKTLSGDVPAYTKGPIFFGGFTFDTLNQHTPLWNGFPDGLLILPTLLFHHDEKCAAITFNSMIAADDVAAECAAEFERIVHHVQAILQTDVPLPETAEADHVLQTHDMLPADQWKEQVATAVRLINTGNIDKVVLARGVEVETADKQNFVITDTLQRLRQSYPSAYVFAFQRGQRYFTGATPERLVCSEDGQIQTMALAGSAPRGATPEEDQRLGAELLNSEKNQGEHQHVVKNVHHALSTLCSHVWVADAPHLLKLKNIQHLETPIMGDLLPGHSILEAIEDLHPTPAVGGVPRVPALSIIREYEQLDRGWYASPVGWIGTSGNGEFAVALRSGLVEGSHATLFAGCGIVADSDPESEYQESCLKLQVMLRGLGGD